MELIATDEMSPKQDTNPMAQRSIRLPQSQMDLINELAIEDDVDASTIIRDLIRLGLPAYLQSRSAVLEYQNKKLVNQKLKKALENE